jgi:hypothetical protein
MTNVVAKIVNSNGEESIKMVRIVNSTKLYAISRNNGVKAPYTLFFEQDIETNVNPRGAILKGSGFAIDMNNRKTALQSFTTERLEELGYEDLMAQADEAAGSLVMLDEKIEASEIFEGMEVNISIEESTEAPNTNSEPKRAGKDGPELKFGTDSIYVDRFLVAGTPTFKFLQHDEFVRVAKTKSPF